MRCRMLIGRAASGPCTEGVAEAEAVVESGSQERQRGLDQRFFHLLRWERRHIGGRNQMAFVLLMTLFTAVALAGGWAAAMYSPSMHGLLQETLPLMCLTFLGTAPFDFAGRIGQASFGYQWLHFSAYLLVAACKLLLPAWAASSVAADRKAGRWHDLQMTPIRASTLYLSKVGAAVLPFLIALLCLLAFCAGSLFTDFVPLLEVVRVLWEATEQILLTACIAVTCSATFRSPWTARTVAYILLWFILPLLWLGVDYLSGSGLTVRVMEGTLPRFPILFAGASHTEFNRHVLVHTLYAVMLCLLCALWGTRRLRRTMQE